jgi:iron complex transport system substrate-binding protein
VVHALGKLSGVAPRIVSLAPKRLDDIWQDLSRVADALGVPEKARQVVEDLRARIHDVVARVGTRPRPRVACIEWLDPPMGAGNWVPELVALAGGDNLFGEAGAHSGWITWDDVRAARPDVVFLMPCGFDLARVRAECHLLPELPGARVYLVDGNQYFNRPGPRLVDSLELLAEALWGLDFGRAAGWQPL